DVPKHKDFIDKEIGADRVKAEREFDKKLRGVERDEPQQQREYSRYGNAGRDTTKDVFKQLEQLGKQAQRSTEQTRQKKERETRKNGQREDKDIRDDSENRERE